MIFGLFGDNFYNNPTLGLKFAIMAMTVISIALMGYILLNKKNKQAQYS